MDSNGAGGGHQGIDRTLALLRAVAAGGTAGTRLVEVAGRAGLSRSTAHRLLASLVAAGLVEQDEEASRYHLGYEIHALGRHAAARHGLSVAARASLVRLEERTEDTVYLQRRSGDDAVCVARQEGRFPIKTLTLAVDDRRPLGIGAGSLALLAALPDAEMERAVTSNAGRLRAFPSYTPDVLRDLVTRTRCDGYATNPGMVVPGMSAVGLSIPGPGGRAMGALSIAAIESRMGEERRRQLVSWLREEAEAIGHLQDGAGREGA
ncbi:IclR family transcriptional regulator [Roseomonas sp. KE2513]|uniref:IclR family transcriptional regulator n=1 Tax=Roseomonas sp. KE2513 TaxID=2479202 RepID=UPI0018DFE8A4|nr:IclR family transcriptional regulator [Roseomonas sp. KE2513]MBI0539007.1 IclR family transcriptional regulator [Roseomonas sp. KE2513]